VQCASAQRYNFKAYGQDAGLTNLDVCCLMQDSTGYLWVGTDNGLFRYDGRQFRPYTTAQGLPAVQIGAIHQSPDGNIWVGTGDGLARLIGEGFERVSIDAGSGVRAIASDGHGYLYVGTGKGLLVAAPEGTRSRGGFKLYTIPGEIQTVGAIAIGTNGEVWYTCGSGVCTFEGGRTRARDDLGLPARGWRGLLLDRKGGLWVRSLAELMELPPGASRFERRDAGLPLATRGSVVQMDRDGNIVVPTAHGLARRTGNGWTMLGKANGLPSAAVDSFLEDREGSAWLALDGAGLLRWLGYKTAETWTESEGLSHEVVWSLARDGEGTLWATTQGGLSRFVPQLDRWEAWKDRRLDSGQTVAMIPDADGSLWIGQMPGGILHLDPRTGRAEHFGIESGLPNEWVFSLARGPAGELFAGTALGLCEGTRQGGAWRFRRLAIPGDESRRMVQAILVDRRRRIWVSGPMGVFRLENGKWTHFQKKDGLLHDNVTYLAEGRDASVWVGYRDPIGISRLEFDGDRMSATHFGTKDGMRSGKPYFVQFDHRGWLWVGTDMGLDRYDGSSWVHLDKSDGLAVNDCDHNAFFDDFDGSVWVGTSQGLTHFLHPGTAAARPHDAPVVLTWMQLGGGAVPLAGARTVPYARRSFSVGFAAMTFANEDSVHFRHRLLGLDSTWTETRQNEAHYPGLAPGRYTLEVQAGAAPGKWSLQTAQTSFTVLPPWWRTWWALAGDVVIAVFIARFFWMWRVNRMMRRQTELEKAVEDRTLKLAEEQRNALEAKSRAERETEIVEAQKVEIERLLHESQQAVRAKTEFLANMSHEVRTPLNGIMGMTEEVLRSKLNDDQTDCLRVVKSSADSLLTVINNALDFSQIDEGKFVLHPSEFPLVELVRDVLKPKEIEAAAKGLNIQSRISPEIPRTVVGDSARLGQVLTNLVGNAIKFTAIGTIVLEGAVEAGAGGLQAGQAQLHFKVRDTGIGIPVEQQAAIFEPFRQVDGSSSRSYGGTGLGLAICKRVVGMMGGRIWVESQPGSGSIFHFTANLAVPAAKAVAAASAAGSEAALAPGLRILLVEDNPVNQKLTRRLLEGAGCTVVSAMDGLEAVAAYQAQAFDVVLMDLQMPNMDGFEATRIIRQMQVHGDRHIPIIAVTANALQGDRERCLAAGMDSYLTKPIKRGALFQAITEMLDSVSSGTLAG
jgi:signal transduction histidine kinase/ligand-binding sensor domain-containing protein/ActR/RegA family two-component response regulator